MTEQEQKKRPGFVERTYRAWARGRGLATGGKAAGLGDLGLLAGGLARPEDSFLAFSFFSFLATASPLHQRRPLSHLPRAGLHGVTC